MTQSTVVETANQRINYDRLLTFKATVAMEAGVYVRVHEWHASGDAEQDKDDPVAYVRPYSTVGSVEDQAIGVLVSAVKANGFAQVATCPGEIVNVLTDRAVDRYDRLVAQNNTGYLRSTSNDVFHAIALKAREAASNAKQYLPAMLVRRRVAGMTAAPTPPSAAATGTGTSNAANDNGTLSANINIAAFTGGIGTKTYTFEDPDGVFANAVFTASNRRIASSSTIKRGLTSGDTYTVYVVGTDAIGQAGRKAVTITIA